MSWEKNGIAEDMYKKEITKAYALDLLCAGHVYMGSYKGYENVLDAAKDEEIRKTVMRALEEIEEALHLECHIPKEKIHGWNENIYEDISQHLSKWKEADPERIGLIKMLQKENALAGSVVLCKNNGIWPYYCSRILAYALHYENSCDKDTKAVREYLEYYGVKEAARKFCGLEKEPELLQLIAEQYGSIKDGRTEDGKKAEVIKRAFKLGFNNEKVYRGCAQCTLLTMFEIFGRETGVLFQSASALSAGMAQTGDGACGGYTGGIMYMGSVIGRRLDRMKIDKDRPAQLESYRMARELRDKFIETYGSVICADVHREIFGKPYCLRTQVVKDAFEEAGAHTIKCTTVIGTASAWVAGILYDSGYYEG